MKNDSAIKNIMPRPVRRGSVLTAMLLLVVTASSQAQVLQPSSQQAQVLPPSSLPYGLSYQEWSAKWWQWTLEQSTNHLEFVGGPGICDGPGAKVQFLAGVYIPGSGGISIETRHVTISDKTPLFFPVLSVWADNSGCPTFTSFTADELAATAAGEWSAVTVITCTIDGVAVAGLANPTNSVYVVQAAPFSYTTAEKQSILADLYGEPCIPGKTTIYPAVADGAYLMLSPLARGKHTIHFVGVVGPVNAPFVKDDITYDITVH